MLKWNEKKVYLAEDRSDKRISISSRLRRIFRKKLDSSCHGPFLLRASAKQDRPGGSLREVSHRIKVRVVHGLLRREPLLMVIP
mgnify:CR=1 FL=1